MGNDWPTVTFGSLYKEPSRNGLTKPKKVRGEGYKFINMGEIFSFDRMLNIPCDRAPLSEKEIKTSLMEANDLLFARQSLVLSGAGKCSIFLGDDEPVAFESHLIRVRLNEKLINPEYAYYYFVSPQGRELIKTIVEQGAGQAGIRGSDLERLQLPLPPICYQDYVVSFMKEIDNKITLNRQINQTLEQMAQTLFKSWFVDFDPVIDNALDAGNAIPDEQQERAEQRQALRHVANEANKANQPHSIRTNPAAGDALASPYQPLPDDIRQLFPNEFEESELGWVPKGWVVKTCEEIAERIGMGPFGSNIKTSTFVSSGVPIINGQQLKGFLVEETFANFLTPEHAEKLSNSIVKPGDIVFTHRGTIGQVSLIPSQSSYDKYIVSQSQFFLRPNVEILGSYYIECFFKSALGQQRLLSNASQVGVPAIARPSSHLKQLKILVPSYDTQDYFETLVGTYIESIVLRNKELKTLTKLRDTLLPKLISGELRLDEVESTIAETTA